MHYNKLCGAPRDAVQDEYEICLDFSNKNYTVMRETSRKIERAYKLKRIDYNDLHIYPDATCCLGLGIYERKMPAYVFIKDYVVPYLYYHSYFFENNKYPWQGLPHNLDKAIEILISDEEQSIKNLANLPSVTPNPNDKCACGSKKKYKKCCMNEHQKIKVQKHASEMKIRLLKDPEFKKNYSSKTMQKT